MTFKLAPMVSVYALRDTRLTAYKLFQQLVGYSLCCMVWQGVCFRPLGEIICYITPIMYSFPLFVVGKGTTMSLAILSSGEPVFKCSIGILPLQDLVCSYCIGHTQCTT